MTTTGRTKREIVLWLLAAAYLLLLIVTTVITVNNFNRHTFGTLFTIITLGPVARFFLLRNQRIDTWLRRLDQ